MQWYKEKYSPPRPKLCSEHSNAFERREPTPNLHLKGLSPGEQPYHSGFQPGAVTPLESQDPFRESLKTIKKHRYLHYIPVNYSYKVAVNIILPLEATTGGAKLKCYSIRKVEKYCPRVSLGST